MSSDVQHKIAQLNELMHSFRRFHGTSHLDWRWHVERALDDITAILNEIAKEETQR